MFGTLQLTPWRFPFFGVSFLNVPRGGTDIYMLSPVSLCLVPSCLKAPACGHQASLASVPSTPCIPVATPESWPCQDVPAYSLLPSGQLSPCLGV